MVSAGRCRCGYRPKDRILNHFQHEALKQLKYAREMTFRAGLVVLPPASGKTRLAAEDAKLFGAKRVLYIAHTHEILDVAEAEFSSVFGTSNVKRLPSKANGKDSKVHLATIQFVGRRLEEVAARKYDYCIVDEFHHAAARTYRKLIDSISPAFLLGLTATPFRGDRQDIAELCDQNVVVNFSLRSGIEAGILSPYHYHGCFDNINYETITRRNGRYDIRDLERALIIPERHSAAIAKWRELAEDKATLAFCCSHTHARKVCEAFEAQGIPAETYLSFDNRASRRSCLDRLASGELKVLCSVDVLNEGADVPFAECLLFLRPTESERIFFQQLGRGLRRCPGKRFCTVIDFIGNFKNAYKIVEYQSLFPDKEEVFGEFVGGGGRKDVLDLPLGCKVQFDDHVIELFGEQCLSPLYATRRNIAKIMMMQYRRLQTSLGHPPTKREVDRTLILDSSWYARVFGGWETFIKQASESRYT
jgi:superfamily II DNA or RNA helicase